MVRKRKINKKKPLSSAKLYANKLAQKHHNSTPKKAPYNTTKPVIAYYVITITITVLLVIFSNIYSPEPNARNKGLNIVKQVNQKKYPGPLFISKNYIENIIHEKIESFHFTKDDIESGFEEFSFKYEQNVIHDSPNLFPEGDTIISAPSPMIAIVIDDMGFTGYKTDEIIDLPAPLSLSFLPYVSNLKQKLSKAVEKGHEVMAHIPMEPTNPKYDAGPNALKTSMNEKDIAKISELSFKKFRYITGANNHMGSKFTANEKGLKTFLNVLKEQKIYFLDSQTTPNSFGKKLSIEMNIPFLKRDVFLDNVPDKSKILNQLKKLEAIALKKGYAIGIGHPYRATIYALEEWLPYAKANGFLIVSTKQLIDFLAAKTTK